MYGPFLDMPHNTTFQTSWKPILFQICLIPCLVLTGQDCCQYPLHMRLHAWLSVAMREAILTNCSKSQALGDLYGRLSIVLVRANARAILARSLQVADMQVDAMDY
eukprot:Em0003g620a